MKALALAFNKSIATELSKKLVTGVEDRPMTKEQKSFFDAFQSQESSIFGEAVAGSGKTWISTKSAHATGAEWECKTTHGLCYSAWSSKIGRRLKVEESKMFKLLKTFDIDSEIFGDVLSLAKKAKVVGLVPSNAPAGGHSLVPDEYNTWDDIAFHFDLECNRDIIKIARDLICASIESAYKGTVDFDDMLYMAVCYRGNFEKFPVILVDEVQDLNPLQHVAIRKSLEPGGFLAGVGDRHQSIYGFRGAVANGVQQLMDQFDMEPHPLTVSFRCPKAVVAEAQQFVPHIQPYEKAIEGQILNGNITLAQVPQTVLCRNTAPLVDLAMRLIAQGRPATIAGREVGKGLKRFIRKLSPEPIAAPLFLQRLEDFITAEVASKPEREERFRGQQDTLHALTTRANLLHGGQVTSETLCDIIDQLFERNAHNAVWLSTIHRAKGLEWPHVLILDPQLCPSKYARQPHQLEQEHNIMYVAVTRAQETLRYAKTEDIR